ADELLRRLENVQQEHDDQWNAKCPGHDDRKNSLAVSLAPDGKVLVKCLAGCATGDVLDKIGLSLRDLFPRENSQSNGHAGNYDKSNNGSASVHAGAFNVVKSYDYVDETGTLLFQVCRMDPKDFRQRRPKEGGWEWKTKGTRKVLYRL